MNIPILSESIDKNGNPVYIAIHNIGDRPYMGQPATDHTLELCYSDPDRKNLHRADGEPAMIHRYNQSGKAWRCTSSWINNKLMGLPRLVQVES